MLTHPAKNVECYRAKMLNNRAIILQKNPIRCIISSIELVTKKKRLFAVSKNSLQKPL